MAVTQKDMRSEEMAVKAEQAATDNPVLQLRANGSVVMIRFSEEESVGLKEEVRDILTAAFEDRILS